MPNLEEKVAKGALWMLSWKKAHEYIRAHNWLLLEWIRPKDIEMNAN